MRAFRTLRGYPYAMARTSRNWVDKSRLIKAGRPTAAGWTVTALATAVTATAAAMLWPRQPALSVLTAFSIVTLLAWIIILTASLRAATAAADTVRATFDRTVAHMIKARKKDSQRRKRYVHDIAAHDVIIVGYSLDNAMELVDASSEVYAELKQTREAVTEAIKSLREFLADEYPGTLDSMGLRAAVQSLVDRLPIQVAVDIPDRRFPPDVEFNAYLIISGALSNVLKHAEAQTTTVRVTADAGAMSISVVDNGKGSADSNGEGLMELQLRAAELHGELKIHSPIGVGTTLEATLPCV